MGEKVGSMKVLINVIVLILIASCTRVNTNKSVLKHEDTKKISLAIQTNNVDALKAIFGKMDSDLNKRSDSDQGLVDQAIVMAAGYGLKCNKELISYLYTEKGVITYHTMRHDSLSFGNEGPKRYKIPLCGNYLVKDTKNYIKRKAPYYYDSQEEYERKVRENYIENSYKYLVEFINSTSFGLKDNKIVSQGLKGYKEVVTLAAEYGKHECRQNAASKGCISFGLFKNVLSSLKDKGYLNKKSKTYSYYSSFYKHLESIIK